MKLLDTVALIEDIPELKIYRGQVGTIVEEYEPDVFEVEFSDIKGTNVRFRDFAGIAADAAAA